MQDQHLYEYAVIRVVPRVEREEFINVGVVLYCSGKKFLKAKLTGHLDRLQFFPDADQEEIAAYLAAFGMVCAGAKDGGTIGKLPPAERFRWLTATRSTVVQASKVHPGFCTDPDKKLEELFEQLVA